MDKNTKEFRVSRGLYIGEAAFEYLVALMVQGTFLARLTQSLGFSDSLTGIISSFISLGCLFQLLSLFIRRRTVKCFVVVSSVLNQLLFMFLYIIPVSPLPAGVKTGVFVGCLIAAYVLYYLAHPKKISWLMSLVEDGKRGRFTANKEIVSLASGIVFTYVMGEMSDWFKARGALNTAFLLTAAMLFILTALHTVSLLFSVEPVHEENAAKSGLIGDMLSLLRDKTVRRIAVLFILWHIASGLSTHFYGTFMNGELQFTLFFSSVLASVGSVLRMLVSRPLGRYADQHSFAALVRVCLVAGAVCFGCVGFVTLRSGKIIFLLYNLFHGFAMAGINSSLTNLIFDYMPPEKCADSLAVCQSLAGVTGFLSTLAASALVAHIQQNGNTFLSMHVYAQQVVSILSSVVCLGAVIYVSRVFLGGKKAGGK